MSNADTNILVEIKNLEKVYPDGHRALSSVSFSLERAEFVVVIGKSGAGKSTLLRCLNGLTEPTSGEVLIGGYDLAGASGNELRTARKEIGFIFQQFNLVKRLSALDNVLCGKLAGMPLLKSCLRRFTKEDKLAALGYLDRVGLADKALQRADTLSGGQQQRVAIARTLAQSPQVVLADEPVASLDPESSRIVMDNLRSLADDEGIAVICNLHQVELAERYADRILGVRGGRIVLDGRPGEVGAAEIEHVYGVPAKEVA